MIDAYKEEEYRRKENELNLKRQELEYPETRRKSSSKPRKIHIVTTPCNNHVVQNNTHEVIVRQINENSIEEGPPPKPVKEDPRMAYLPPQQIQHLQQLQQQQQQHGGQQYVLVPVEMMKQKQLRRGRRSSGFRDSSSTSVSPVPPPRRVDKSVACQTSDRVSREPVELEEKISEDWLTGFDVKDGEKIDVDEEDEEEMGSEKYMKRKKEFEKKLVNDQEYASEETRVSIESDSPPKSDLPPVPTPNSPITTHSTTPKTTDGFSDPAPKKSPPKNSNGDKSYVASQYFGLPGEQQPDNTNKPPEKSSSPRDGKDFTGSGVAPPSKGSSPPGSGKKSSPDKKNQVDKSFVTSQYFGQPGEQLASNNNYTSSGKSSSPSGTGSWKNSGSDLASSVPPSKGPSPPGSAKRVSPNRNGNGNDEVVSQYNEQPGDLSDYPPKPPAKASPASIFPYFVDPKTPSTSVSTSKASSKLTDPELAPTDSSCALYRQKKKKLSNDSAKVYKGTPPAKTPK